MRSLFLLSLLCGATSGTATPSPDGLRAEYDYIVVGSGPGGGPLASNLARAGFSTLLLEAGDDESANRATNVAALFASTGIPDSLHWDFWVRHYDDDARTRQFEHLVWRLPNGNLWVGPGSKAPAGAVMLGVNYPRGATLGGSSIINAGAVFLPSDSDWDHVANITGDRSWRAAEMRRIFTKLEKNLYLPRGTPGHGFDGYLEVNIGDGTQYSALPQTLDFLRAMVSEIGQNPDDLQKLLTADPNFASPTRDTTQGLWALPFHVNKTWGRYSARNRVLDTLRAADAKGAKKYPLDLRLNTLVSRVLFETDKGGGYGKTPRAVGVEYLEGKSLYKGDPRYDAAKKPAAKRTVRARREVILSGGTFNTPQLLQLSGIGPRAHLAALGIPLTQHLPGVGTNMQDNQEIAVVGLAARPFVPASEGGPVCARDKADDPCYALWLQGKGPYANAGPNSDIFLLKTPHSPDGERDVTMFAGPFAFRGFWPATPNQSWPEPPTTWGIHAVKMHPQNRAGYVRVRSADPTEMPEINFKLFEQGAATDIGAMKDAVAWGRRALQRVPSPAGPVNFTHPPCPAGVKADGTCTDAAADEEWIRSDTFGHHATSTCAIGADNNEMAVLDSKFRVRGVRGLRVVDASVFPRIPGSFPVVATYIVSEKAAEVILADR